MISSILKQVLLLFLLTVLFVNSGNALAESRLRTNIISDVNAKDFFDETGNNKFSSIVVGYDSAVTDYSSAAKLAITLTAYNKKSYQVQLSCSSQNFTHTLFVASEREISFRTDIESQSFSRILVGGPLTNNQVQKYPQIMDLLKEPGDIVIKKYSSDIVIAGYSAFDTQRGIDYLIDIIKTGS